MMNDRNRQQKVAHSHSKVALLGLGLLGCGAGAASTDTSSTTETQTGSETDTGSEIEPLDCPAPSCSRLSTDGTLETLIGSSSEQSPRLACVLAGMQSQWWPYQITIEELIDGAPLVTELLVDGVGGAIVMQSDGLGTHHRVEHCELAPLEFFAACAESFTAACANLDNWLGPCSADALACPMSPDCGLASACPEVVFSPESEDDFSCVWQALRDAEMLDVEVDTRFSSDWEGGSQTFYLDANGRNVGLTSSVRKDIGRFSFIGRCELRPAAFFQGCLDDPNGDGDCLLPERWVEACVEQPRPCAD